MFLLTNQGHHVKRRSQKKITGIQFESHTIQGHLKTDLIFKNEKKTLLTSFYSSQKHLNGSIVFGIKKI